MNKITLLFLFSFMSLLSFSYAESNGNDPEMRRTLGIGLAYTGGLIRYGFKKAWSVEAHYIFGSKTSELDGSVSSSVIGLRGYRHFRTEKRLQFFTGAEADYVGAKSNNLKTTGYTLGGFGGVEYYIFSRLSIGFDMGPYYLSLQEQNYSISDSGVDFIFNSFINFYIF